jgi:hypothetical protein
MALHYRMYSLTNMYLSGLQKGLQTGHMIAEMFLKYEENEENMPMQYDILQKWARKDKTIIILDGGNCNSLWSIVVNAEMTLFPYASFYEDTDSLGGALTCVGVLLPDKYYKDFGTGVLDRNLKGNDLALLELIQKCRLAV